MRWLSRRRHAPPPVEPIEAIDLATLEVVELDADGGLRGPSPGRAPAPEIAYAPRDRDPTSLAGLWEALAGS
jgi:hypothetical protein